MKKTAFLLLSVTALAVAGCHDRRVEPSADAERPAEDAKPAAQAPEVTLSPDMEAIRKDLLKPLVPAAYAFYLSDDPERLAQNVGNAAKFIVSSERYQKQLKAIPEQDWSAADRRDLAQNERFTAEARAVLKRDSAKLSP
jgi:hypothetical protein